jgi:hypothetical protein
MTEATNFDDNDLTLTPGGQRRKDLVHVVRPGEAVRFEQGHAGIVVPSKTTPTAPGAVLSGLATREETPIEVGPKA